MLQTQNLREPLPRGILKDIVQDRYVDFAKINASFSRTFDSTIDDMQDLGSVYALVKKDSVGAKIPITTESAWTRAYDAWAAAVCVIYNHRVNELAAYRRTVVDIFHYGASLAPNAIRYDEDMRDRYSKNLVRLDNGTLQLVPLLTQALQPPPSTSSISVSKRSAGSAGSGQPSKRAAEVCLNWNCGTCESPCRNRRMHDVCSECSAKHPARDAPSCWKRLRERKPTFVGRESARNDSRA